MTHADAVRDAERAALEASEALRKSPVFACDFLVPVAAEFRDKMDAMLDARAATCPECGGTGETRTWVEISVGHSAVATIPCPAGCDNGRVRQ